MKKFIKYLLISLIIQSSYSQNELLDLDNIKNDTIIFNNGEIRTGKIGLLNYESVSKKGKIKLCNIDEKNCESYYKVDIREYVKYPKKSNIKIINKYLEKHPEIKPNDLIERGKILYHENDSRPFVCQLIFKGSQYSFYTYNSTSTTSFGSFNNIHLYINKNESNVILEKLYVNGKRKAKELLLKYITCVKTKKEFLNKLEKKELWKALREVNNYCN